MTTRPEHEGLGYFRFKPTSNRSSSSSPPISPSATVENHPSKSSPLRPGFKSRPQSEYDDIHSRVKVQTIEEDVTANKHANRRDVAIRARSASTATGYKLPTTRSAAPTTPVRTASLVSRQTTRSEGHRNSIQRAGSAASTNPPARPRPGHAWSRSKSGSIWYERLKQSPRQSHESSRPAVESSSVPKRLLTPLRPPLTPVHRPIYNHEVKIETSFTDLRRDKALPPVQGHPDALASLATSKSTSRRNSIDPRRLFSTPLRFVQKLTQQSKNVERGPRMTTAASLKAESKLRLPDHKSSLRRKQTSEALKQVASILEQTSPVSVINPLTTRTFSYNSTAESQGSQKHKYDKKMAKGLALESAVAAQKSLRNLLELNPNSPPSSQIGFVPQNTPDERATYKVKRSPSVETEEFLKIDISTRGGTSYLPSEARRIHTPPLPQDGLDGRKRGFFFDYNAPKSDKKKSIDTILQAADPQTNSTAECKLLARDTSEASTVGGRRPLMIKRRITSKTKTGDWYDAKLAELDIDEDESVLNGGDLKSLEHRGRSTTETSCSELALARRKREEEQMDYGIPEHLPNSPLCPRNKRYWRVVQGRGSQYRGCWMHGVGEYDFE